MKTDVYVRGGASMPQQVSFVSDRYVSTARFDQETCEMHIKVKPSKSPKKYRPFLGAFDTGKMMWKAISNTKSIFLYLWIGLFLGMTVRQMIDPPEFKGIDLLDWLIYALILPVLVSYLFMWNIKKWHGAEHMVFAAYHRTNTTDLKEIKKENRVDEMCGTRFLLPMTILLYPIGAYLAPLRIPSILYIYLTFEFVIFIDRTIGLMRIPVIRQMSLLMQTYVVTKEPNENELETAQAAMKALLERHAADEAIKA